MYSSQVCTWLSLLVLPWITLSVSRKAVPRFQPLLPWWKTYSGSLCNKTNPDLLPMYFPDRQLWFCFGVVLGGFVLVWFCVFCFGFVVWFLFWFVLQGAFFSWFSPEQNYFPHQKNSIKLVVYMAHHIRYCNWRVMLLLLHFFITSTGWMGSHYGQRKCNWAIQGRYAQCLGGKHCSIKGFRRGGE